jgi:hypothetical protein
MGNPAGHGPGKPGYVGGQRIRLADAAPNILTTEWPRHVVLTIRRVLHCTVSSDAERRHLPDAAGARRRGDYRLPEK